MMANARHTVSSRSFFNLSNCALYSASSALKFFNRSNAFSCFSGISSFLEREE